MPIATASGTLSPVYFLLHIPRTAGQTIEYHLVEHGAPGTVWLPEAASPAGRLAGRRYSLAGLEDPARLRALCGHHLGRSLEGRVPGREIRRAVLLRDPLSAALSLYNYRMMNQLNKGLGTHGFELHLRALPRDWMTHFLLNRWLEIPWPLLMLQLDAAKYAMVNRMLRQFWFVGSYADCDRLIAALAPDLGVPPTATARNSTRQWQRQIYWEPLTEERLAPSLRQAVLEQNPLDWALWSSWRGAGLDPASVEPEPLDAGSGRSFFRRELARPAFVLAREAQRRRPSWLRGDGLRSGVAKGDVARNAGNWPVAAEHYRRALAEEPRLPAIWVQYGHALKECGEAAAAEDAYRQALKYDAANADAWARLGDLVLAQHRPEEAVACLEEAVRCDPEAVGAWRQYAGLLSEAGDAAGAERAYREVVRLQPADRDSWAELGHLLMEAARPHEAGECYANAVAAGPASADLWVQCGHALKAAGDLAGAIGAYRRGTTLAPDDGGLWVQLADILATLGRRDEAAECYRKAVAIAPERAPIWVQLGHMLKDDGDFDGAARAYRAAVRLRPEDAEAWSLLGFVLMRGEPLTARGCLSRATELAPGAPAIWVQYGHVLQKLGELDAAELAYRHALRLEPVNADTWVQIGIVWELRWRPLEAAACYVRALALDPNLAAIWLQLGHMLRDVGGISAAIRAYREAVRRDPENGKMWLHLGNALARQKQPNEAADCRRRAVELDMALADALPRMPELAPELIAEGGVSGNFGSQ